MSQQAARTEPRLTQGPLRLGMRAALALLERDFLPDPLIRAGVRGLLKERLRQETSADPESEQKRLMDFVETLKSSPIAVGEAEANKQHYELPTEFFRLILGRHMKYSCGYWAGASDDLDQSEETRLGLICERAEIANGRRILDLGCGWGAFSLFAAERYPDSDFTAVSNSRTQKFHVAAEAERRALDNLSVIKADVSAFQTEERFDRIVSV